VTTNFSSEFTGGAFESFNLVAGGSGGVLSFSSRHLKNLTITGSVSCADAMILDGVLTLGSSSSLSLKNGTVSSAVSVTGSTAGNLKSTTGGSSATLNVATASTTLTPLKGSVQDIYSSGALLWVNTSAGGSNVSGNTGAWAFAPSFPGGGGLFSASNF
jgi:hypothetical protein